MEKHDKRPTVKGPAEWFTGDVWLDPVAQPHDGSALNVAAVTFAPGARTAWHSHAGGQTLWVTDGRGLVQTRGEAVVPLAPGDTVWTPDGEEHWHGAAPDHRKTHVSMTTGAPTWGDHVTDDEYGGSAGPQTR